MRLVWKWECRENVVIAFVSEVLLVFENRIEAIHTISSQQADVSNHPSNASSSESTTREANQNDLVSRLVIGGDERIDLSNVFADTSSKKSTSDSIDCKRSSTNAGMIIYHLTHAVWGCLLESSCNTSDIAWNLKRACRYVWYQRGLLVAIVAIKVSSELTNERKILNYLSIHVPSQHKMMRLGVSVAIVWIL